MSPRASSDGRRPSASDVFRHDPHEGSIRLPDGQRLVALSQPLIQNLHLALAGALGDMAQQAFYRTGYEWALQGMLRLNEELHGEFGSASFDFWQLEAKFVLDRWWAPLHAAGWGTWSLATSGPDRAIVELRQSAVAGALNGADRPVCHLYAGLFAGALSFLARAERHAVEVQCHAMGHETCKFVVGPGTEIDSAETWREQGMPVAEIIRRLG